LGHGHDRVADPLIATASPDETSQFGFLGPEITALLLVQLAISQLNDDS